MPEPTEGEYRFCNDSELKKKNELVRKEKKISNGFKYLGRIIQERRSLRVGPLREREDPSEALTVLQVR